MAPSDQCLYYYPFPSSFSAAFVFTGQAGRARSNIVICINPTLTQMIHATEKPKIPSKFAKRAARYYESGSKGVQLQIVTPARYQWIQIDQADQLDYVNTSR